MKFLLIILLVFTACAPAAPTVITRTEYKEVVVSVPCTLPVPQLSPYTGDAVEDMLALEQYIYELRLTVDACKGLR